MASSLSLATLPFEILEKIFVYVSTKDLARCSRVCKRWYELLENEDSVIWRARFEDAGSKQFRSSQHLTELMSYKSKVLSYECAWNDMDRSENIYLLEDCLTLHRNPVAQSSDGIRGKTGFLNGQHYFVIIFQGPNFGSSALVGVATKDAPVHSDGYVALLGNSEYGWAWDLSMSTLKHNGEVFREDYGSSVKIKDRIGMTLDMDSGQLDFDINGKYLGVGFTDLPRDKPLYPSISAVYGNSEVTMIYYGRPVIG